MAPAPRGRGPAAMLERWQQVYRTGEAALHPFTRAELDSVILDAAAMLTLPGGAAGR